MNACNRSDCVFNEKMMKIRKKGGLREIKREEKGEDWGISGFLSEGVFSRFQL